MNPAPSSTIWFQLLALLAIEAGLVSLVIAVTQRHFRSAAWRRTFCQTGIIAVLLLALSELSGAGRFFVGWMTKPLGKAEKTSAAKFPLTPALSPGERENRRPALYESSRENAALGDASWNLPPPRTPAAVTVTRANTELASRADEGARLSPATVRTPREEHPGARRAAAVGSAAAGDSRAPSAVPSSSDSVTVFAICLIWGAGAAVVAGRMCVAQCLFTIFRLRRRRVADPALLRRVRELAQTLKISRRVRVIESAHLRSPIAFGLFHPTVGLPADFATRFEREKQEVMLAHELAHLAAHDPFWCLLADVATACLWWHPGVWWLRGQLHLAGELTADEASLLVVDGPRLLAECLVQLGTRLTGPPLLSPLRVAGFRSSLGCRVERLIQLDGGHWSRPSRIHSVLAKLFGPIAFVAIGLLCTAWVAPQALTKGESMKTIQQNWKSSLAAFALLAAVQEPKADVAGQAAPKAVIPPVASEQVQVTTAAPPAPGRQRTARVFPLSQVLISDFTNSAPLLADIPLVGRFFRSEQSATGKMNFLMKKAHGVLSDQASIAADDRANTMIVTDYDENVRHFAALVKQFEVAAAASEAAPEAEEAFRQKYRQRYGLSSPGRRDTTAQTGDSPRRSHLEARLSEITLPEVSFDGLPLSEVLRWLRDEALKRDKNSGLNFLIAQNFARGASPEGIDPATGLPLANVTEPFDTSGVTIKFSLPLRNVTMKNVLDAIVNVADHPIEYSLEDYAVVFSPKGNASAAPARMGPAGPLPTLAAFPTTIAARRLALPADAGFPLAVDPATGLPAEAANEGMVTEPRTFNIDFGVWRPTPSKQVGPAAVGQPGDFWNSVGVPWDNHHTESGMKFATREPSAIQVEMINLAGAWGSGGLMGVKSPMLDSFNYPMNNQGGDSTVILHEVPAGKYDLYIYGHGSKNGLYYGDYAVTVGDHEYGRKSTTHDMDAEKNTQWVEGGQYVKFAEVKVGPEENLQILIRPGGTVTDESGRTFADAMICGLQLVPVN